MTYRGVGDDPQREIETLRVVSHPNIVELLHVFEPYGQRVRTVLVFLESDGDLGEFLRRRTGRGLGSVVGIVVQLLAALEHVSMVVA